ncbi:MAG: class I SAM-dependent methyltransferase [Ignavibacteriae bacterium]|nr:MAG: class I SAM-dependent methyltransferase [Ignavibacteriota bacterium]
MLLFVLCTHSFDKFNHIKMLKAYVKLAELYEKDWGKFSLHYINGINNIKEEFHLKISSVLDISCGTGDLINELKKCYEVAGSDISPDMINIARKKFPSIEFHISDMANLKLNKKYDLVLSTFDSINYLLDYNHFDNTLKNIFNLLNPAGYFLFDYNTDVMFREKHSGIIEREAEGIKFKQILEYNDEKRIATTIFDFGNDVKEIHIQKAYNYDEIKNILEINNFKIIHSTSVDSRKEVDEKTHRVLILAGKKK